MHFVIFKIKLTHHYELRFGSRWFYYSMDCKFHKYKKGSNVTFAWMLIGGAFKRINFRLVSGVNVDLSGKLSFNRLKLPLNGLYLRMDQIGIVQQNSFVDNFSVAMWTKTNNRENKIQNEFHHDYDVAPKLICKIVIFRGLSL